MATSFKATVAIWAVTEKIIIENKIVIPTELYQSGSKSLNIPVKSGNSLYQSFTTWIFVFATKITIP